MTAKSEQSPWLSVFPREGKQQVLRVGKTEHICGQTENTDKKSEEKEKNESRENVSFPRR